MNPRYVIAGSLVAVVVVIYAGFLVASGPEPHIAIPPEILWTIGPLDITSTLMAAWLSMLIIIVAAFFATRSMKLIPSGFQNFIEAFIDFLLTQCEEIAGKENGRKFFVVAATFFIFILVANWSALLPIYKTIGLTQDYGRDIFIDIQEQDEAGVPFEEADHTAAWQTDDVGGWGVVFPGADTFHFEFHEGWTAGETLDAYIVALAEHFTDFEASTPEDEVPSAADVTDAYAALEADPDAPNLLSTEGHAVESPALGMSFTGLEFPGEKLAMIYPFLRPAFSDVNNTLALAVVAFIVIWFWGFQAQGVGYLGKFFVAPWKDPIMSFVGILELISEFIRVISFSFRLFGNIFAGSVLLLIMAFLVPFIAPITIYGLELFVGLIQAIVFSLLVLVFGIGAVESHDEDHDEGHGGDHHADDAHSAPPQQGTVQA